MHSLHKMHKIGEEEGGGCRVYPLDVSSPKLLRGLRLISILGQSAPKCIGDDLLWFEWVTHNPALRETNFMTQSPS